MIGTNSQAYYLKGTVDILGSYTMDAIATYVYNGTRLNMTAIPVSLGNNFNYNTIFISSTRAAGQWVNDIGSGAGYSVNVDLVECGAAGSAEAEGDGPTPAGAK